MKRFVFLLIIIGLLVACTSANAEPGAPQTPALMQPGLSTVAPTSTAVISSPTAVPPTSTPSEATMTPAENEPVSPIIVDFSKLTPVPPIALTPIEQPRPGVPDPMAKLISEVSQDLARRLNIDVQQIAVERIEEITWPDGALGCPEPGMGYITVLIPGYRLILAAQGNTYDYHAAASGAFVLCGANGRPVP